MIIPAYPGGSPGQSAATRFQRSAILALAAWWLGVFAQAGPAPASLVWTEPSRDSSGSMPLGNGDLALNLWVEKDGALQFYLSKSDAWDSYARLLKLGRMRVELTPNPFRAGEPFRQELQLARGAIEIEAGTGPEAVRLRIWADANHPVVRLEMESSTPHTMEVRMDSWRRAERPLSAAEHSGGETFAKDVPAISYPDTFLADHECCVVWYQRNPASAYPNSLRHQDLGELVGRFPDPLLGRTFGGALTSTDLSRSNDTTLRSAQPILRATVAIHALTAITPTSGEWVSLLEKQKQAAEQIPLEQARQAHERWWQSFWERSWIQLQPSQASAAAAEVLNRGYVLQRFLNACAGRGAFPIKFNGSLFTVDVPGKFDGDYRQWGGCYWFQNTRLPYWPMLASGDFDLMQPLFRMYADALPLCRERTRIYFHHEGAFFPETMQFWGTYHSGDMGYGWDRAGEPLGRTVNRYIRYHWSGSLELLLMMLDHFDYTGSEEFLQKTVLPFATETLRFFAQHYPRQPNGKILLAPAQSLETWWECENPMPEVAGLHAVLPRLLSLPEKAIGLERAEAWRKLQAVIPPIPVREVNGARVLLPAESWRNRQNAENPELYAIFPFRNYGLAKPDLEVARLAFARREVKGNMGWQQDDTQAALLGLTQEAARMVVSRLSSKHEGSRFPAFWGPNFDWIPDQDHGGNALMTLQTMLLQSDGSKIYLLPAWPKEWDVEFKLHAPQQTTVEGVWRQGRFEKLAVIPPTRARDLVQPKP